MIRFNKLNREFSFRSTFILKLFYSPSTLLKSLIILTFIFIHDNLSAQQKPVNHPDIHKILVDSVIQTSNYTYVKARTELNSRIWLALPKKDIQENENYYYYGAVEMGDFKSTELKRVFPSILFINDLIDPEDLNPETALNQEKPDKEKQVISPPSNGISIAELFNNRGKYNNKIIRVKGEVTKYNEGIMSRNWIHLKDYSSGSDGFDLTATTQMETQVGDIIILEGKIILNKDFGSGYFYEILMEDGKIIH